MPRARLAFLLSALLLAPLFLPSTPAAVAAPPPAQCQQSGRGPSFAPLGFYRSCTLYHQGNPVRLKGAAAWLDANIFSYVSVRLYRGRTLIASCYDFRPGPAAACMRQAKVSAVPVGAKLRCEFEADHLGLNIGSFTWLYRCSASPVNY